MRTIVVETAAQRQLEEIGDLAHVDEAIAAMSAAFEEHPERYPVIVGELRVGRFFFIDGAPPIRVLFEVTDEEIRVVVAQLDPEQLSLSDD